MKDLTWQEDSLCKDMDTAIFFPKRGEKDKRAQMICHSCPVRAECLTFGLNEKYGIWGGLSEAQRREVRRMRRERAA